jgi:hypothetical protein
MISFLVESIEVSDGAAIEQIDFGNLQDCVALSGGRL